MPVFEYSGVNAEGKSVKGFAHGESIDAVARQLSGQGLTIQSLSAATGIDLPEAPPVAAPQTETPGATEQPRTAQAAPPLGPRGAVETRVTGQFVNLVPLTSLQFFFSQLSTLLNAGINPADGLETLSRQTHNVKLKAIIKETKEHVMAGRPISAGLQRYPEVFTPLMLSMVRVGEEGGFLAEQCKQLSEYIQRDVELRNMIKRETAMPKITVVASIVIILGTNLVIQFVAPDGLKLPVPWLIWFVTGVLAIGAFLFTKLALPQPQIRQSFDKFVLGLPGIGGMVHGFAMAKFGRAFGALYKGGVDLPKAVRMAADATGNEAVRTMVHPATADLEQGRGVTDTLTATGAFSPLVLDMARTGETTGNLDEMLVKMSEYYEDEGTLKAQMSAKIVGVVCLLIVAVYVCFILITFYTQLFSRIGAAGSDAGG